jgi:hypothetical protein
MSDQARAVPTEPRPIPMAGVRGELHKQHVAPPHELPRDLMPHPRRLLPARSRHDDGQGQGRVVEGRNGHGVALHVHR